MGACFSCKIFPLMWNSPRLFFQNIRMNNHYALRKGFVTGPKRCNCGYKTTAFVFLIFEPSSSNSETQKTSKFYFRYIPGGYRDTLPLKRTYFDANHPFAIRRAGLREPAAKLHDVAVHRRPTNARDARGLAPPFLVVLAIGAH